MVTAPDWITKAILFFFFKQKTAYEITRRDWSSDVCSSDLSGQVDTRKLQVQYYLKFANPLFALIMAMISIPFGFLVGNRGAMTGIGASIVIGIAYWGVQPLFEKIGDVGLLPPAMAAWSPDVLFSLMGLYLLLRMRS